MQFFLNNDLYALVKSIDFSELENNIEFNDKEQFVSVKDPAVQTFQVIISEEIDVKGLSDDQNNVNSVGRSLYALYDEVYYQIHKV